MKYRKIFMSIFVIGLMVTNMAFSKESVALDSVEILEAIKKINQETVAAASRLDGETLFGFMHDSAQGLLIQNGLLFMDKKAALESYQQGIENLKKIDYTISNEIFRILSQDIVLYISKCVPEITTLDGKTFSNPFMQTLIFQRTDGVWKIVHAHQSSERN